jgi:hypothetical protein
MDLHAYPFRLEVELLPELFDDALADVAERSDVIGEDAETGGHGGLLRGLKNRDRIARTSGSSTALARVRAHYTAPGSGVQVNGGSISGSAAGSRCYRSREIEHGQVTDERSGQDP